MAPDTKPSERDESRANDSLSDDSSSDSDSDSDNNSNNNTPTASQPVEWLATGRERRSTAGNRMKSMLANEEPDSDLELLFAEDENDQGFTGDDDGGSDVHMDSSSDDEDDNNNAGDDLEGEKELERQAKERRAAQRKRRAQDSIPAKFRKKVRIEAAAGTRRTPTVTVPAPRPKKKSERASWLPSPADLPTRASSRQTTRLSKEQLHQQMMEREERRLKQLDQMAKKAARLEASKKPPMTQEERLREAAIVEKRNSKSLNRWEVAEKQREEERRAKLAALNERTLKGPVITFWSGLGEFTEGKSAPMGIVVVEEKPKKKRKVKDQDKDKDNAKAAEGAADASIHVKTTATLVPDAVPTKPEPPRTGNLAPPDKPPAASPSALPSSAPAPAPPPPPSHPSSGLAAPAPAPAPALAPAPAPAPAPSGIPPLDAQRPVMAPPAGLSKPAGFLAAPTLAPPPGISLAGAPPSALGYASGTNKSNVLAPPNTSQGSAPPILAAAGPAQSSNTTPAPPPPPPPLPAPALAPAPAPAPTTTATFAPITTCPPPATAPTPGTAQPPSSAPPPPQQQRPPQLKPTIVIPAHLDKAGSATPSEPLSDPPPETPPPETITRNAIIFQNFDENQIKDRVVQTQILFNRKMSRIPKPSAAPLCVITNHPARYRDPKTGLPYFNAHAYREIQRLCRGEHRWSRVLGAWVGTGTYAARGVPERFLHPEKESPNKKALEEKKRKEEEEKREKAEKGKKDDEKEKGKEKAEEAKKDSKEKGEAPEAKEEAKELVPESAKGEGVTPQAVSAG